MALNADRRARRIRAGLIGAALLWVAIVAVSTALLRVHARWGLDATQDRIHSIGPVAPVILGRLDDVLQVELYFTERIEDASLALAKTRLLDQMRALERLAPDRIQRVTSDPSVSAEARLEAQRYGLRPFLTAAARDAGLSQQLVYLGAVLRYRGRERELARLSPDHFEATFLEAVQELVRPRRPVVGWWSDPSPIESFSEARAALAERYVVEDVGGLAEGLGVPDHIDALVVVRPREAHPRAVYAIDRYLARGGRVLLFLDRSEADLETFALARFATGFEAYLDSLGIRQTHGMLFDRGSPGDVRLRGAQGMPIVQPYPMFARLGAASFSQESVVTRRLDGAELLWVHPLELGDAPQGVERIVLARSSERSHVFEPTESLAFDPESLRRLEADLVAQGEAGARTLAVALLGHLPSPFTMGPPPARDPLGGPDREVGALPAAAGGDARLVVVADADLLGKRGFTHSRARMADAELVLGNRVLLDSLVAWLALEPELVNLRARRPRDRRIRDFLAEELEREDLSSVARSAARGVASGPVPGESAARARAERREWTVTAATFGGALALVAALDALARLRRRAPLVAREEQRT